MKSLLVNWKIIFVLDANDEARVHRFALAKELKKSGFFETLLRSDTISENFECMSTVKPPKEVVMHFPHFLDYLNL
jgi:hypothetical protein